MDTRAEEDALRAKRATEAKERLKLIKGSNTLGKCARRKKRKLKK